MYKSKYSNATVHQLCDTIAIIAFLLYFADNQRHGKALLGVLDYVWLFPYAIAMFFRYKYKTVMKNNTFICILLYLTYDLPYT